MARHADADRPVASGADAHQSDALRPDARGPDARRPAQPPDGGWAARVVRLLRSKALRRLFALAVLLLLIVAVVDRWSDIDRALSSLSVGALLGAEGLVLVAMAGSMLSWRALLGDLGSPLSVGNAVRIFFLGQLGKYLPGSVWTVLAQMELGAEYDVPRDRSAAAALVAYVVTVSTGGLVGIAALPYLAGTGGARGWSLLVVPVGLVLLHPRVLNPLLARVLRLVKRPPLEHALSGRGLLASGAWSVVCWAAFGLQCYLLAHGVWSGSHGGDGRHLLALAVGGYALAWVAGFLFVVAPAGAGVRETVLTAVLAVPIGRSAALTVAVVSRLLLTLGDVLTGVVAAALLGRGRLRELRSAPSPPDDEPVTTTLLS